jgi:hypothetical protein
MKFICTCGATIYDHGGEQANKAHVVADQDWFGMIDAIDEAIESTGLTATEREAACMHVRALLGKLSRPAWQCAECGRVHLHDAQDSLHGFAPELQSAPVRLFASRAPHLPP